MKYQIKDYLEAKEYINNTDVYGSVYGLSGIKELLRRLSNPQDDLKYIHIAGTNGKGSVCAFVSSILQAAGYITGMYCSPALFSCREGIQVNGVYIKKDSYTRYAGMIKNVIHDMTSEGFFHPTKFEIETTMAFLYFKEKRCDIVALETGLGGMDDATNVVNTTIMEIITTVGNDHNDILGNTIQEIIYHKAGIIKDSTQVVSIKQNDEVVKVIKAKCAEKKCNLIMGDTDRLSNINYGIDRQVFSYECENGVFYKDMVIHMTGVYQINNAVIAIEAVCGLNKIGFDITEGQLREGLNNASIKGRFTVLRYNPMFIIDGAHNESAALLMVKNIKQYFEGKRIIFIIGIFKDKNYEGIVCMTAPLADKIITVNMEENKRLLTSLQLKEVVQKYNENVYTSKNIDDAVGKALKIACNRDIIIAFGSFSFLNRVERAVDNEQ